MNKIVSELQKTLGPVHNLLLLIFGLTLAILAFATVFGLAGIRLPLATLSPINLVYLCGAYWLLRGGKL